MYRKGRGKVGQWGGGDKPRHSDQILSPTLVLHALHGLLGPVLVILLAQIQVALLERLGVT